MKPFCLSDATLAKIRELIEADFASRDELYAAVETLDDESRKKVCRHLAEHLAAHGIELQQIMLADGHDNFDTEDASSVDYVAERAFLAIIKDLHGTANVLAAIEQCERNLKQKYDEVLEQVPEREAQGVLQRQRDEIEFGEKVLHSMHNPPDDQAPANDEETTP